MARSRTRKSADIQPIADMEAEARPSDEALFIEVPGKPFWAAKKLSSRRAVRFQYLINRILADISEGISSINLHDLASTNWADIVTKATNILDEDNYYELLSIASGHTRQEIEAKEEEFDYYEAWQCVADFFELNRVEDVFTDFFIPVITRLISKEVAPEEQPPA